jgi:RimJ/RimL family protein N-acetyltransferase
VTDHWQPLLTTDESLLAVPFQPRPQGMAGLVSWYKRYKMEADLENLPQPILPAGFHWLSWCPGLIEAHAETLYQSFCLEIDAVVFPSLGDRDGCRRLITDLSRKSGLLPQATWLVACEGGGFCGTIQGIRDRSIGAIQNVGVVAACRGRSLGRQLVLQALHGFRQAGLRSARLEVTAENERAIRVYRRLGFRRVKTLYKAVPTPLV